MTKDKALKLALDGGSLYEITGRIEDIDKCIVHRSVIKEALARPEPSQGSWVSATDVKRLAGELDVAMNGEAGAAENPSLCDVVSQAIVKLAQTEQSTTCGGPVAVKHMMEWVDYLKRKSDYGQHLQIPSEMSAGACWDLARELEQFINTPPKLTPLTDEEIKEASLKAGMQEHYMGFHSGFIRFARAIEAAHGIKGDA